MINSRNLIYTNILDLTDFLFSPLFYCEQRKIGGDKKKGGI